MTKLTLNYYQDPGHGWVKINRKWLSVLNIEDKISRYSYMRKNYVYLEEDCDAPMFSKRCELDGAELNITEEDIDSDEEEAMIRSHNNAYYGDLDYFGELEQNLVGLEEFFNNEEDDYDSDDEEEEDEEE